MTTTLSIYVYRCVYIYSYCIHHIGNMWRREEKREIPPPITHHHISICVISMCVRVYTHRHIACLVIGEYIYIYMYVYTDILFPSKVEQNVERDQCIYPDINTQIDTLFKPFIYIHIHIYMYMYIYKILEWSCCRFTYSNLVTTSTMSKSQVSLHFVNNKA